MPIPAMEPNPPHTDEPAFDIPEGELSPYRLQTLIEAELSLIAELSPTGLTQKIPDLARQVAGARYAALGLPDGRGGLADFIPSGLTQEQINDIGDLPRGRGILGVLLKDPRPIRLRDLGRDPRFVGCPPYHPFMSSFLGVPIQRQGQILGYLYLAEKIGAPEFSIEDQRLVEMLVACAAVAMENARRHDQERRRGRQLQLINEISQKVTSTLDLDAVLGYATRLIRETFGYYAVNIGLVQGDQLVFRMGLWGPAMDVKREGRLRVGHEGITGWVAASAQPLLVPDVSTEPRYYPVEELPDTRSELAVPICWGDQVLGVLDVQSDRLNGLDEEDLAFLESLAPHIALAIQNARLYQQAEQERDHQAMLLQEVRHRIKNNLQRVVGFLSYLRAHRRETELAEALPVVIERLKAMAAVQDALATSPAEAVEFQGLVTKALEPALTPSEGSAQAPALKFEGLRLFLAQGVAEALALALHELAFNAVQHGRATMITIRTAVQADRVLVEVSDNGIGLPADFDLSRDANLGLSIVDGLVRRSLKGSFSLTRQERGTKVTIDLPADILKEGLSEPV